LTEYKHRLIQIGIVGLIAILNSCSTSQKNKLFTPDKFSEYIGRYALKTDLILEVKKESDLLTLRPSFWRSSQILDSIGEDKFSSLLHPQMQFEFVRDNKGKIVSLLSTGHKEINGTAKRLDPNEHKVVELLLLGNTREAITKLKSPSEEISEERLVNLGFNLIQKFPSKANDALTLVSAFESEYSNSIDLQHVIALGSLLIDNRANAITAFKKAAIIDSNNSLTKSSLRLLDPANATPAPENSWELPFDMDELFKKPSPEEIENVLADWQARDLGVKRIKIVDEQNIDLNQSHYTIQIISHEIYGNKHYGAVLIPKGAKLGSSPVVLELHGVDPQYSPFKITDAETPFILGENQAKVIIAIPSFRGNTFMIEDRSYVSEGSPTNAYDRAADDAIAFLNVVLERVPEVDPTRISAFGKSRGGTVALLVGVRDKRISSVIDWAGPAEWFSHMGTFGWTLKEQVQWALWERWAPGNGWGSASQYIDHFLVQSIEFGESSLKKVRHKILASSPLYFLDSLPVAQLQYGTEDGAVPISNAEALQHALKLRDKSAPSFEIYMHKNTGHDMPYPVAYDLSREFLIKQFSNK